MTDVLARFTHVRKSGDGWTARCPAHDDRQSSLSIARGTKHPWVLKCHAGCTLQAIVDAAGLQLSDIHAPRTRHNGERVRTARTTRYGIRDIGGALVAIHMRTDTRAGKRFSWRRPNGSSGLGGLRTADLPLYGCETLGNLPAGSTLVVCEGEVARDAVVQAGLAACGTVTGATGTPSDASLQPLCPFRVVLWADHDAPGAEHMERIAARLRALGCRDVRFIQWPGSPPGGDAADYHGDLRALVDAAPEWNPSSPAAVDLGTQLDAVLAFLRQYVVLTVDQAVAVTLWIAHTHAFDAAECTPYLQITSATRRTGKTRLLEISEPLVARPWLTGRVSAAALVRRIDEEQSTLLLDESDAAFKGEKDYAEALRGILNSGYRRSGRSTLCVGQGSNIRTRDFRTFSPKAIAGIGALPGTIADRAIPIALKRRTTQEPCARYREREVRQLARPMQDVLSAWAASAIEGLRAARPALPDCINDRAADCWEPLLAIAELAGHHWPAAAMRAAVALSGDAEDGDGDLVVDLLHDIRTVFEDLQSSFIASSLLVTKLAERDDRPWATWGKQGKGISGHAVARLLKPFGIVPLQSPDRKSRGYYEDRFADAWARYPTNEVSNRPEPNKDGLQSTISDCPTASAADTSKTQSTPIDTGVSDTWTLQSAKKRHDGGKV